MENNDNNNNNSTDTQTWGFHPVYQRRYEKGWRVVKDYEGLYWVNDECQVKRIFKNGKGKILKLTKKKSSMFMEKWEGDDGYSTHFMPVNIFPGRIREI